MAILLTFVFVILMMTFLVSALIGLISPKTILPKWGLGRWSHFSRLKTFGIFFGLAFVSFILMGMVLTKYNVPVVQQEKDKLTFEEAKSKAAKRSAELAIKKAAELSEKAKNIPPDDIPENFNVYSELVKLRPKNELYKEKYKHYKGLKSKKDAAEKAVAEKAATEKAATKEAALEKATAEEFETQTERIFSTSILASYTIEKREGVIVFKDPPQMPTYFRTGDKINKVFAIESTRLFRDVPGLKSLEMTIPLKEATHSMSVSREQIEKFYKTRFSDMKGDLDAWREQFIKKYDSKRSRRKFARRYAHAETSEKSATEEAAAEKAKGKGKWNVSSETSEIDDSTNVYLTLAAEKKIKGRFSQALPVLILRCNENKTDAYVKFDIFLSTRPVAVTTRLDKSKARTAEWSVSTDYKAAFVPGSNVKFIRNLMKHDKLLVQVTPHGQNSKTTTFDLRGLEEAVKPLQKACNWK
ncbi:type VI secretion system-associated protein TagO [Desulfococcaceae bacterium HSG8]|nr:type VI secretion system-associated protein TagO [Desulfococcaceae bacterium HSG8]